MSFATIDLRLKGWRVAAVEWIEMAERINVFPLAILGTLVVLGLIVWWALAKTRAEAPRIPGADEPVVSFKTAPGPAGASQGTKIRAGPSPSVDAPPPAKDPGEKILEGADRAFETAFYETALKFYKDFELRYAGSATYDRNVLRVFERIHTSGAKMPKKDDTLPAYLDARRKAADEWTRLKPLLASPPTDQSRAELQKYQGTLPPLDGRKALIDAWGAPAGGEK
ncbi:MAG TPA: hypothetical protein VKW04_06910 [Planctomycetota bacterium]|nr:hypothetical protein [Planctomycetota bacterium]